MRSISCRALSGLSFLAAAGFAGAAVDGPVGRDAEKGDPARWYQPADTPQEQYRNAMQEAQAALAEALGECRAQEDPSVARECEAQARQRHEDDVERARGFLVRSTLALGRAK
jgi:hypothetical protein